MRISLPFLLILAATPLAHAQTIWYVDGDGNTGNGCTSWQDACPELQTALEIVETGDQIWVAAGRYLPDYDVETGKHTGNPHGHFRLQDGVAMYGGFAGWEKILEERAGLFDDTILSGDLAGDDLPGFVNYEGNTRHVVLAFFDVDETCILDGFTITAGHANLSNNGSGLRNLGSSPSVTNCTFLLNLIGESNLGAGVFNDGSDSTFTNCKFIDNASGMFGEGVGMYNKESNVTLTDCLFQGNTTGLNARGGGMFNIDSDVTLTDCVFDDNCAFFDGGGLYHQTGTLLISGSQFVGNSSFFGGGGVFYGGSDGEGAVLVDCLFRENEGIGSHGGGLWSFGEITLNGCEFTANRAFGGGGLSHQGSWGAATLSRCLFAGNQATGSIGGGGGFDDNSLFPSTILRNCLFLGNSAWRGGAWMSPEMAPSPTAHSRRTRQVKPVEDCGLDLQLRLKSAIRSSGVTRTGLDRVRTLRSQAKLGRSIIVASKAGPGRWVASAITARTLCFWTPSVRMARQALRMTIYTCCPIPPVLTLATTPPCRKL